MGVPLIKKDFNIKLPDVAMPLIYPGRDETSDPNWLSRNKSGVQQTKAYGIIAPLIQVNDIAVDFQDVVSMNLRSTGVLPEISLSVRDRYKLLEALAVPDADNYMIVQILPPIEDAYKKIKLLFYISSYRQAGDYVSLTGTYKNPDLLSSRFQSLGRISTTELFEWASNETGLGLATNMEDSNEDSRWIYCDNKSVLETLNAQIGMSGDSSGRVVLDWWIDLWNCLNLCNIYERWTAVDPVEDMMVWTTGQLNEVDPEIPIKPIQVQAWISNLYTIRNTELYALSYQINSSTGSGVSKGTDKCYGTWLDDKGDWSDELIQDGDVKDDVFLRHEYLGEIWNESPEEGEEETGTFNYMLAPYIRDAFMQKIYSQTLEVTLQSPLLGLIRGMQCLFEWYINDSGFELNKESLEEKGLIETLKKSAAELVSEESGSDGHWIRNDRISGQYTILGQVIEYEQGDGWRYKLTLSRPQSDIPAIIKKD